jgi:hypothetical protein
MGINDDLLFTGVIHWLTYYSIASRFHPHPKQPLWEAQSEVFILVRYFLSTVSSDTYTF